MCFSSFWMGRAPRPPPKLLGFALCSREEENLFRRSDLFKFLHSSCLAMGKMSGCIQPPVDEFSGLKSAFAEFVHWGFHSWNQWTGNPTVEHTTVDWWFAGGCVDQPTLLVSHHNRDTHQATRDSWHGKGSSPWLKNDPVDSTHSTPGRWPLQYCFSVGFMCNLNHPLLAGSPFFGVFNPHDSWSKTMFFFFRFFPDGSKVNTLRFP